MITIEGKAQSNVTKSVSGNTIINSAKISLNQKQNLRSQSLSKGDG
jgi:hypothetical protein